MPVEFKELCQRGLLASSAAATAAGYPHGLPPMKADICLVNFYPPGGKLGMHQVSKQHCRP
eukprot:6058441-Pyramimonas_sp.AAC.1